MSIYSKRGNVKLSLLTHCQLLTRRPDQRGGAYYKSASTGRFTTKSSYKSSPTTTYRSYRNFYTKTGVKEANVYFVRQRHEKDGVCRKLGITYFIDDRLEVLSHMIESTPNLILFQPDDAEVKEFEQFLPKVTVANDWSEVVDKIIN